METGCFLALLKYLQAWIFGGYILIFLQINGRNIIISKNINKGLLENRNIYMTFIIEKNYEFIIENGQHGQ